MPTDAIAAISPVMQTAAAPRVQVSRPPETTPDARAAAEEENNARRMAEAVSGASPAYLAGPQGANASLAVGNRENVVAVPSDVEGSLQRASAQISRAYSSSEPSAAELRAASEAYQAEATARDNLARQQQGNGTRSIDVTV